VLYVGKAINLRNRVKSYFTNRKDLGEKTDILVSQISKVKTIRVESEIESLLLEANLIKKHNPKYNTKEKDNKSYNYVAITKDDFPRIIILRGRGLAKAGVGINSKKYKKVFGPYPSGESLRLALKIIRRIFPYLDAKTFKKDRYEFYKQISLAPDVAEPYAKKKYVNNIKHIIHFLEGKKATVLKSLEREMYQYAKVQDFEHAHEIKKQIFALNHINEVSLIKSDIIMPQYTPNTVNINRIEAYDISHISGSSMVGAFSVIEMGEIVKEEYRSFNIRGFSSSNDAGALEEVLRRRLKHNEWQFPDLIIADGNQIQKSVIEKVLQEHKLQIPVVAAVKGKGHKVVAMIGNEQIIKSYKKQILLANAEVHRFALSKHKQKRAKNFLGK
jgi:excinuclease UvrABC nuclease subunit